MADINGRVAGRIRPATGSLLLAPRPLPLYLSIRGCNRRYLVRVRFLRAPPFFFERVFLPA